MIEPLRFNKEIALACEINRPAYCSSCLSQKQSRLNPNIAIKYCPECPSSFGHQKDFGAFLCKLCDDSVHDKGLSKLHVRRIIVVGPGVRKKMKTRGDAINFPMTLDQVTIKVSSKIYHGGKRIHKEPSKSITFLSGTSGKTLHVQVLGARNLVAGDIGGMSDPFVVYSFCGKTLGSTRVRPSSLNPRWNNETFIVPMEENLPPPRDMVPSQKDLFKLEVYDYDWFSSNEFLGHLEISKSKLMKMAVVADQQPIRLPLSLKEYHGSASVRLGFNKEKFFFRMLRAESLDKQDAILLSSPFAKVFLGFDNRLIGTTSIIPNTIHPDWGDTASSSNEFSIPIEQLLLTEQRIRSNIQINRETQDDDNDFSFSGSRDIATHLMVIRVEMYSHRRLGKHILLGQCQISCDDLRQMLPTLPSANSYDLAAFAERQRKTLFSSKPSGSVSGNIGTLFQTSFWLSAFGRSNSRFAHSNVRMHTADDDDEEVNYGAKRRNFVSDSNGDDDESDDDDVGFKAELAAQQEDNRQSVKTVLPPPVFRAASLLTIVRRSLSSKITGSSKQAVDISMTTTWSGIYPVNVVKDSAKNTAVKAVSNFGLGASNGHLIVRLIPSNRGSVVVGIDDAVRQMSLGEKATVKCRYDYAYNNYCMGSNIPPRANIVFSIELQQINGKGRLDMPWRVFKRIMRRLTVFFVLIAAFIQRIRAGDFSFRTKARYRDTGDAQNDNSSGSDSDDSSSDSSSEGGEADRMLQVEEEDDELLSSAVIDRTVKADVRMRKHLNQSVKTGSQLMWGYAPPKRIPPPPQSRKKHISAAQSSLDSLVEDEEEVLVEENDVPQQNDDNDLSSNGNESSESNDDKFD